MWKRNCITLAKLFFYHESHVVGKQWVSEVLRHEHNTYGKFSSTFKINLIAFKYSCSSVLYSVNYLTLY